MTDQIATVLVAYGPVSGTALAALGVVGLALYMVIVMTRRRRGAPEAGPGELDAQTLATLLDRLLALVERNSGAYERLAGTLDHLDETLAHHHRLEQAWHAQIQSAIEEVASDVRDNRHDIKNLLGRDKVRAAAAAAVEAAADAAAAGTPMAEPA